MFYQNHEITPIIQQKSHAIKVLLNPVEENTGKMEPEEVRLKHQSNSAYSLLETLVAIGIFGMIAWGVQNISLRSQENTVRETLRKTQADLTQDLTRRLNHHFKRHTAKVIPGPNRLVLTLPSGKVEIETVCLKNELDWQAPGNLLNRCTKCRQSERPVIRIQERANTHIFPGREQKPDRPAAASICFKNGSDPNEVEMVVEILAVDPVKRIEKKVSKFESFLIKDLTTVTSFE